MDKEVPVGKDPQEPEEGVFCPGCGEELTNIWVVRSVELEKDGGKWIEQHVFSSGASCPKCCEELGTDVLQELGVPAEWQ